MALGGGTWVTQTKVLPGVYINNVSSEAVNANAGDRGTVAIAVTLNWGEPNKVKTIELGDFYKYALELFGYEANAPELVNIREAFKKAKKVLLYRLDNTGVKASNTYAEAIYPGTRGNDLKIVVQNNIDSEGGLKDVTTILDGVKVDTQTVKTSKELKDNKFVTFKTSELEITAGSPLSSGTDGSEIGLEQHQAFLDELESYSFNTLACATTDTTTKKLYIAFTERLRKEIGKDFQVVVHNYPEADSYSVISVKNNSDASLVYWVAGAAAGVDVNETLTNKKYDGELKVDTKYSQAELELALKNGEFVLHKCENEVRVLLDINTLTTYSDEVGEQFSKNQVIRIIDGLSMEYAYVFTTEFLGKIQNDVDGRIALWNRFLDITKKYENKKAILPVVAEDITVEPGADKASVFSKTGLTPLVSMEKLYLVNNIR